LGVEQQRIKVIVSFDKAPKNLRPGTSLDLKIITAERKKTLWVPERSLFKKDKKWHVFKRNAQGEAELQPVTLGLRNEQEAEILKGLQAGEFIVEELDNKLKAGMVLTEKTDTE